MSSKIKMKVVRERATTWITVKGLNWIRNGYPEQCVDKFGDVWLKPHFNATNLYATVSGPQLFFSIDDECLVES